MSITQFGAFILGYETFAKLTRLPTWTTLTARRSPLAIPVLIFWIWLGIHLAKAKEN